MFHGALVLPELLAHLLELRLHLRVLLLQREHPAVLGFPDGVENLLLVVHLQRLHHDERVGCLLEHVDELEHQLVVRHAAEPGLP